MLRYLTAGESHGECLVAILDGIPAGLEVDARLIDRELARRQNGFGRGSRMKLERDSVKILSGLRRGKTIGSPIAILIKNRDFSIERLQALTRPRPGHADLAGALKYNFKDARNVLERASARETASRVGVGALCRLFLQEFKIDIVSHTIMLGGIKAQTKGMSFAAIKRLRDKSSVACADTKIEELMIKKIMKAQGLGDTLGGVIEVIVVGAPAGLGSYAQADRRLDGKLAAALMSIQAIKAVEIGGGIEAASLFGSQVHDAILYKQGKFARASNNAGGLEGGVTNGEPLILRAYMKPIATLARPLASADLVTKRSSRAAIERSDVCALPAAGVVCEAVAAYEIANAMLDKFGGDNIIETKRNYEGYLRQLKRF